MKRRLAGLLLALALPLASGCWVWPTVGAQPYTIITGAPVRLKPGFGGEVSLVMAIEEYGVYGHLGRFSWTHHEGRNGGSSAEYLRLGASVGVATSGHLEPWVDIGMKKRPWANGAGWALMAAWHQILVNDGPGDRGGPGLSFELAAWLGRKRGRFTLGCTAEGWVSTEGDLIGALAPYVRFGFTF